MKNMKVLSYFILCLLIFSQTSQCVNTIKLNEHISLERLKKDPLLEISITQSLLQPSEEANTTKNFQFFLLKSASRHKNKAYLRLLKSYQKLVNTLIQKLIIGDQRLLIKSKIKQKYMKKKRLWQFGIMFMMQGQAAELEECYHEVVKLGVAKMNSNPQLSALNERIIASNAFYKLKQKVLSELSRMPGMTIQKVTKVDIRGFSIPNSIGLEKKDIQMSIQDTKEEKTEEMSYFADFFFSKVEVPQQSKSVTIKAIFQIGEDLQISINDFEEQSEESEFQSDSDDDDSNHRSNSRKFQDQ